MSSLGRRLRALEREGAAPPCASCGNSLDEPEIIIRVVYEGEERTVGERPGGERPDKAAKDGPSQSPALCEKCGRAPSRGYPHPASPGVTVVWGEADRHVAGGDTT